MNLTLCSARCGQLHRQLKYGLEIGTDFVFHVCTTVRTADTLVKCSKKGQIILKKDYSKLKRRLNTMPIFVKKALEERGLMKDFYNRPPYQQNDYIGWIERAKRQETKEKRLSQMLDELEVGGVYMKMNHPASSKS